jgi:hypothetical protein
MLMMMDCHTGKNKKWMIVSERERRGRKVVLRV